MLNAGYLIDIPREAVSLIQHTFLQVLVGFSFLIVPCRLPTDLKRLNGGKICNGNWKWELLLSRPPRTDIWISELFGLGLSVEICRHENKYMISRNKCWVGYVVQYSGGRKASIFVLTSANIFPGIREFKGSPYTNQTR